MRPSRRVALRGGSVDSVRGGVVGGGDVDVIVGRGGGELGVGGGVDIGCGYWMLKGMEVECRGVQCFPLLGWFFCFINGLGFGGGK